MTEQLYQFIDKSGHCFEDFQRKAKYLDNVGSEDRYRDMVGAMLRASNDGKHNFSVGDMMCFRDELQVAGFKWGKDFFIIKSLTPATK